MDDQSTPEGQADTPENLSDLLKATWEDAEAEERKQQEAAEQEGQDLEAAPVSEDDEDDNVSHETSAEEIDANSEVEWDEPPPERWPSELKDAYNELPLSGRKLLLDGVYKPMQRSHTQATMELSEQRKQLQPILDSLSQHNDVFVKAGVDPAVALKNTMDWAAHITKVGPEKGLADMRASYGLDEPNQQGKEEVFLTPNERVLQDRIDQLEGAVNQKQQNDAEAQRIAEAEKQRAFQNYIASESAIFVNEKKDGKPAHPHYEELGPQMKGLMNGGLIPRVDETGKYIPFSKQLSHAYEMALRMSDKHRPAQSSSGQVRKARAAGRVDVASRHADAPREISDLSIKDELQRQIEIMQGKS